MCIGPTTVLGVLMLYCAVVTSLRRRAKNAVRRVKELPEVMRKGIVRKELEIINRRWMSLTLLCFVLPDGHLTRDTERGYANIVS